MKNAYPHQQFSEAVRNMAVNPASIQDRIVEAFTFQIGHVKREDLPESTWVDFDFITGRMHAAEPQGKEGYYRAAGNTMTDAEAVNIAERIVFIADAIATAYYEIDRGQSKNSPKPAPR